jgi:hypothetical protein
MSGCWTRVFLAYSLGTKVEVSCSSFLSHSFLHTVLGIKDEVSLLSQSGFQFWFFS